MLFLFFYSCGYHFSDIAGRENEIRSVAVELFSNETSEPTLEFLFTRALRDEFIKKGNIELTSVDKADAVFKGRVINIYTVDVAHTGVEQTSETRIFVVLDVKCEDVRTGKVLWQDNQLTFYEEYKRGAEASVSYNRRRAALEYLARQVAERIYDRFTNRF